MFYHLPLPPHFPIFQPHSTLYLPHLYHHNIHLLQSLHPSPHILFTIIHIYLSFHSNPINHQIPLLTLITIIFIPLTLITAIYPINF
ncbi:CorA family divalent cation transporter, partial [Neisseria sicca]|uniref:CorA family divalent cation transporter n=1 Tax=Neisseria sicca TaxID=490 RepID=UPI0034D960BA